MADLPKGIIESISVTKEADNCRVLHLIFTDKNIQPVKNKFDDEFDEKYLRYSKGKTFNQRIAEASMLIGQEISWDTWAEKTSPDAREGYSATQWFCNLYPPKAD